MAKVSGDSDPGPSPDGAESSGAAGGSSPLLTIDEQAALAKAPKRAGWRDVAGKIWNAPNTAIGSVYGGLGMAVGEVAHILGGAPQPKVFWRDNAVQFTNNPLGGVGAITLGNTTTWKGDPYDPADEVWHDNGVPMLEPPGDPNGHTYPVHETQHTYQGEQLGPLYLPSNLLGGLNSALRGEGWHGPHNWNEVGPQARVSTPWPAKRR
jgi:hypothetical protein